MEMSITAKIKIMPDKQQQEVMKTTMTAYRDACNYVSEHIFQTYTTTKGVTTTHIHKVAYTTLRERFGLLSQMACSVIRTTLARYKTNETNKHDWTLVKFKRPVQDVVFGKDYSFPEDKLSLGSLVGRQKTNYTFNGMEKFIDNGWKYGTATLVNKHGKWFLHIAMTKDFPDMENADVKQIVGADLGMNFIAVTQDSKGLALFFDGRMIKHKRAHYKQIRSEMQRKKTTSSRRRIRRIGSRENRWMHDVNHCITKALVTHYGANTLFVLEDLTGIRGVTERVHHKDHYTSVSWTFFQFRQLLTYKDHYTSVSWTFFQFRQLLTYKAALNGSRVIAVDPRYTSQDCPLCGYRDKANRDKRTHTFKCKNPVKDCGYRSNDDRIAAMNLHAKGIEYLETNNIA